MYIRERGWSGPARWWVLGLLCSCASDYEVIPGPVDVDPGEVTECDFTRLDDTDFYAYDCNPVFTTTGEDWAPAIGSTDFGVTSVLGHAFYQLWYTGVPEDEDGYGDYGLGYAVSTNGTDWQPHGENPMLEEPGSGAWDASNMDALQVIWDPTGAQYVMLYQGYNLDSDDWGLGVATSADGKNWSRLPNNPVLDLTSSVGDVQAWCWPLGISLGRTEGFTGYIAGMRAGSTSCELYAIEGSNAGSWTPINDRVLGAGSAGDWDDEGFLSVSTAELGGLHHMFYVGFGRWKNMGSYLQTQEQFLGMATSTDGETWTRESGPLPITETDVGAIGSVAALTVGERIHLWVTDEYDDVSGVGLFLYDPDRAQSEGGEEGR